MSAENSLGNTYYNGLPDEQARRDYNNGFKLRCQSGPGSATLLISMEKVSPFRFDGFLKAHEYFKIQKNFS